ncbi:hypothetical protein [Bradyrhizobium sp. CCBAU 45321]|uniref:hypothetical protein n=1 Tax=Bradyrhizobium sp. CCBAU 45321 TaxID=1641878 RepID=UPI002302C933|nr:hypothetical protein [Bradyrhizobium sp. CCBAU 45321]
MSEKLRPPTRECAKLANGDQSRTINQMAMSDGGMFFDQQSGFYRVTSDPIQISYPGGAAQFELSNALHERQMSYPARILHS